MGGYMSRLLLARRRQSEYGVAAQAVLRHVAVHGTVNRRQASALLAVSDLAALRHLTHMEHDGLVRRHGHAGIHTFYTRG